MTTRSRSDRRPRRRNARGCDCATRLQDLLPRLVLAPSFLLVLVFVYGFNLWTLFLSFTNSKAFTNQARRLGQLPEAVELDLRNRPAVELVHGASSIWGCSAASMSSSASSSA